MRNSCIPVPTDQYCDKCKKPLLGSERFYIFPCLHSFHRKCLIEWMREFKMYVPKFKLTRLERIYSFMERMDFLKAKNTDEEQEPFTNKVKEAVNEEKQGGSKGFFTSFENLFTRQKTRQQEEQKKTQISEEDQETLRIYEHQLEAILTEDCILCGHLFIESVDVPFDSSEEFIWTI
eukprot:TRINITY_DN24346_c0_g4_i1.p1 TRINITY_DN24346_c0_g4~~TRINITY_DN24346_c0_g4_i1.p1  ORF type:complete len:197 (-),score=55.79 TRINITY_DN24346_c0_g4_i1:150-680(-)